MHAHNSKERHLPTLISICVAFSYLDMNSLLGSVSCPFYPNALLFLCISTIPHILINL